MSREREQGETAFTILIFCVCAMLIVGAGVSIARSLHGGV